jgi:hypothetical protein
MVRVGIGARIGIGGVVLGALASQAIAPAGAQAPASAQELTDRLRQIQGEVGFGTAPPGGSAAPERQAAAAAAPALDEDEVRTLIRTSFGVEVLKIEPVESEGRPAYAVTVMHPPGDYDGAFRVETLLMDGATAELLGRVPQRPRVASGFAEPSGQADLESGGPEIRRRSFR